jgi:hypothetical protein
MNLINQKHVDAAIRMPICPTEKSFKRLKEMVGDNDLSAIKSAVNAFSQVWNSAWRGEAIPEDVEKQYVSKGGPSVYGTRTRLIETFETNTSDFIDMDWTKAYRIEDLQGDSSGEIEDFRTLITWAEIGQGKKIEPGAYGDSTAIQLREKRYAAAVAFLNRWLKTNSRHNINRAMSMMLLKNGEFKADDAYADIASGSPSAVNAGASASPADIITGLNEGVRLMTEALDTAGYGVTAKSRVIGYTRTANRAIVERALNQVRGDDGTNETLFANIEMVYTINSNLPVNPGGSGTAGVRLVLPERKNVWGIFEPLRSNEESDFRSDSVIVAMQEYWNKVSADNQKRTVTFA